MLRGMTSILAISTALGGSYLAVNVIGGILVGFWGRAKGYSFWLGFFVSVLLSVVVGVIAMAVQKDKVTGRRGLVTWKAAAEHS